MTTIFSAPRCSAGESGASWAQGAVAEIFAVHLHGRKQQRDGGRGQQVVDGDGGAHADAARAFPAVEMRGALEETD